MVLSSYAKQRILFYRSQGYCSPTIRKLLAETDGIFVSKVGVWKFLIRYKRFGTIARQEGSGRPTKITPEVERIVKEQMENDDETTAFQIHKLLTDRGIRISLSTILHCRLQLGWTYRGSAYCQLIRHANKEKRLLWCQQHLNEAEDGFENVVWTDESTIQIETHKRHAYRKKGCAPKPKPRY